MGGVPGFGAPGDAPPEEVLCLAVDGHPLVAGLLTEAGDPSRLGRRPGHLVVPGGNLRRGHPPDDQDLVTIDGDRGRRTRTNPPAAGRPASRSGLRSAASLPPRRAGAPGDRGRVGAAPPAPKTLVRRSPVCPMSSLPSAVPCDYIITLHFRLHCCNNRRDGTFGRGRLRAHDLAARRGRHRWAQGWSADASTAPTCSSSSRNPSWPDADSMTVTGRSPGSSRASSCWSSQRVEPVGRRCRPRSPSARDAGQGPAHPATSPAHVVVVHGLAEDDVGVRVEPPDQLVPVVLRGRTRRRTGPP